MQLINERTRTCVADSVDIAETRRARRRGLLGREGLRDGEALMLSPCLAIHTAFMRFSIDLVFVDGDGQVVRTVSRVRPWRMAICLRARSVIELPGGHLDSCPVQAGDRMYLAPVREQRRAS